MLKKHNSSVPRQSISVKTSRPAATAITAAIIGIAMCAPASASSKDSLLVEKTITAKFKKSDLEAPNGVKNVYAKLVKTSRRACAKDSWTMQFTGESLKTCVNDLVGQMVESSNVASLEAYHVAKTSAKASEKLALND